VTEQYYAQELFETTEELSGYLKNLVLEHDQVGVRARRVRHGTPKRDVALASWRSNDRREGLREAPGLVQGADAAGQLQPGLGSAGRSSEDGKERVYFVIRDQERACSLDGPAQWTKSRLKIDCGKAHFRAIEVAENPARYTKARVLEDVLG
jgi:type III restriction enzyme